MRIPIISTILILLILANGEVALSATAAPAAPVEVGPIQVTPQTTLIGQHPRITAEVKRTTLKATQQSIVVNVIAVVVLPDNRTKSWTWKNVALARGAAKEFSLPNEYDVKLAGKYKIAFHVYSADMRHRLGTRSTTFSVILPSPPAERKVPERAEAPPHRVAERNFFGVGVYGNILNPAGGATLMLWPFQNIGLQGTYTVGTFTSYEARLLAKLDFSPRYHPYIGAGYLSVSKEADIIGITTEFRDKSVSGVIGVEIPLGRSTFGYIEVSGNAIHLEKMVTNGTQTVKSTVEYTPATIGIGIVYYLF
jgi:hypothetical protein